MFGLIAHACAFFFGLTHWWWCWENYPYKSIDGVDGKGSKDTLPAYVLLLSWLCFLAAIIVNVAYERKKGEGKITSILGIVGCVFGLYYFIAWLLAKESKRLTSEIAAIRHAPEYTLGTYSLEFDFWFPVGRFFIWLYLISFLAGGALPAVMGGLIG